MNKFDLKKILLPMLVFSLAFAFVITPVMAADNNRYDRDMGRDMRGGMWHGRDFDFGNRFGTNLDDLFVPNRLFNPGFGFGGYYPGWDGGTSFIGYPHGGTSLGDLFILNQLFGGNRLFW